MSSDEVAVLVAFWALLAAGLAMLALLSGRRRRVRGQAPRFGVGPGIVVVFLVFGLVLPGLVVAAGKRFIDSTPRGQKLTPAQATGRRVFAVNCAGCHTLAASEAVGAVGPSLDALRPSQVLILDAIKKGRARGNGVMPVGIVSGPEARDVADYVAAVAGR